MVTQFGGPTYMYNRLVWTTVFSFFLVFSTVGQGFDRNVALLDLDLINGETANSGLFSAEQVLIVAGMPYLVTADLNQATLSSFILCSSALEKGTLDEEQRDSLRAYVEAGGVIVAPIVTDTSLYDLFGITAAISEHQNFEIHWNDSTSGLSLDWMDEPEELSISLGNSSNGSIFKTYAYTSSTAQTIGVYGSGERAVVSNTNGLGTAYAFGCNWKEVIMRNQINRDYDAQRVAPNGFEPTQDVFFMLLRDIYTAHVPFAVWKHTSPNNSTSTLMVTHDIDSATAMDSLAQFSTSEANAGISATYNITVHYFSDALISDFYLGSYDAIQGIISDGHVIASHSVGHFFDFDNESVFPMGSPGNTQANYTPHNDGVVTTGGTVFGELEVSKNVLEQDHGVEIRLFRAGHLAYHELLIDVMDSLGYEFNSSYNATDVLTHFPYRTRRGRSFNSQISNIYEFPVSLSDVFHDNPISDTNYLEKANQWIDIATKIDANHGMAVFLIHPNRAYKLKAQNHLLSQLPGNMQVQELSAFGDYWKARVDFSVESLLRDSVVEISIDQGILDQSPGLSLVVANGQQADEILVKNDSGEIVEMLQSNWKKNDVILYNEAPVYTGTTELKGVGTFAVYPNPATSQLTFQLELMRPELLSIELYSMTGKLLSTIPSLPFLSGVQRHQLVLDNNVISGPHLLMVRSANGQTVHSKVVVINR